MSNKIRVRFERGEEVKYISHLDLMKTFERALRRARLPISYSQGFNPHPHMVFALPLSVGVTSEAEYADFELSEPMDPEDFKEKLNKELPQGLRITASKSCQSKDNIMAIVSEASYDVLVRIPPGLSPAGVEEIIRELEAKDTIIVQKKTKSGMKDVDIRPMLHKIQVKRMPDRADIDMANIKMADTVCISLLLSAGSMANLRPELVIDALNKFAAADMAIIKIHRTGLFTGRSGKMLDPLDE